MFQFQLCCNTNKTKALWCHSTRSNLPFSLTFNPVFQEDRHILPVLQLHCLALSLHSRMTLEYPVAGTTQFCYFDRGQFRPKMLPMLFSTDLSFNTSTIAIQYSVLFLFTFMTPLIQLCICSPCFASSKLPSYRPYFIWLYFPAWVPRHYKIAVLVHKVLHT